MSFRKIIIWACKLTVFILCVVITLYYNYSIKKSIVQCFTADYI